MQTYNYYLCEHQEAKFIPGVAKVQATAFEHTSELIEYRERNNSCNWNLIYNRKFYTGYGSKWKYTLISKEQANEICKEWYKQEKGV